MTKGSVKRQEVLSAIASELKVDQFKDYCPNGLQVQGGAEIRKIVSAVTASQRAIDMAVAEKADMLLVHHGYFWKGEPEPIVGMKYQRIRSLIANNINLAAYHLPLDAHPVLGNNAQLGQRLGLYDKGDAIVFSNELLFGLALYEPLDASDLAALLELKLDHSVVHINASKPIRTLAWCTGGAQGYIDAVAAEGVDAFISGEISEQTTHSAREQGVHYFAAGHHATERYGVQALGEWLSSRFGLEHRFVDDHNPA